MHSTAMEQVQLICQTAAPGLGTVFELAHGSSTITALASFNGTVGEYPYAGLVLDSSDDVYGTAQFGGSDGIR